MLEKMKETIYDMRCGTCLYFDYEKDKSYKTRDLPHACWIDRKYAEPHAAACRRYIHKPEAAK